MNREKFIQAMPVHERLVAKESEIADLKDQRDKKNKELADLNNKIDLANKERIALYEEFKVI